MATSLSSISELTIRKVEEPNYPRLSDIVYRSGYVGFPDTSSFGDSYKLVASGGSELREVYTDSGIRVPSPKALPCIRVSNGRQRFSDFKIPQLSMYPYEFRVIRTTSKPGMRSVEIPRRYRDSFVFYGVTIPVQHILSVFDDRTTRLRHMYDVQYSTVNLDFEKLYSSMSPITMSSLSTSDYSACLTDNKNDIEYNLGDFFIKDVLDSWASSNIISSNCSGIYSDPEVVRYLFETFDACNTGDFMTFEDFCEYVPFWIMMYPNKHIHQSILKDLSPSGTINPLGNVGHGYARYLPPNGKCRYLNTGNKFFADMFGCKNPMSVNPDPSIYMSKIDDYEALIFNDMFGKKKTIKINKALPEPTILASLAIKNSTKLTDKKIYFPFRRAKFSKAKIKKSDPCYKYYSKVAFILAAKDRLDKLSTLINTGHNCPKCGCETIVPRFLDMQSPDYDKLLCYLCGAKYLVNFIAHNVQDEWLYFKDFDIDDVVSGYDKSSYEVDAYKLIKK